MQPGTLKGHTDSYEQVLAIRGNDEKALKLFYQNNFPKVERYVLDNNGTTDEAKDIYQEAFIAVWRNIQLDRFQPQKETSLDGYIYQVAKNKWLDQLRAAKRRQVVPLTDRANEIEEAPALSRDEQQQIDEIKKNLKLLGQPCRDVIERFYYHKQSMRTISASLNWTEATAKNNKYRCIQRLRNLLKKNQPNLG